MLLSGNLIWETATLGDVFRVRSKPIFVQAGNDTITLVEEVGVREISIGGKFRLGYIGPTAVFVIDNDGVRRISLVKKEERVVGLLLLGSILLPLVNWLVCLQRIWSRRR
jgi:hypothetical protein